MLIEKFYKGNIFNVKLDIDSLDFDHCEDEPIHRPELIQSYGYLFALDRINGKIQIISQNVRELLKVDRSLIGENFFNFLESEDDTQIILEIYESAKSSEVRLPLYITFKSEIICAEQERSYYAIIYNSDNYVVIELEPAAKYRDIYKAYNHLKLYSTSIAPKYYISKSLNNMAQEMVNAIRYITSMDRVVLYKFIDNAAGKVIAESKAEHMPSYLNLFYPASDIPKQARELYKKNWIRLIADVDLKPSPLIPSPAKSGRKPLDMTNSVLRDVSPIHKQYIRNQGISSSLSMSLVTHGELWGMISCHSEKPTYIPQNLRLECENLSQVFSWQLYAKEEQLMLDRTVLTDKAITSILNKTAPKKSITEVFEENEDEVLKVLNADGFIFYSNTEEITLGVTPHFSVVKEIFDKHYKNKNDVFHTQKISDYISEKGMLNGICGMLMIAIGGTHNNFTAWFRKEMPQVQSWAGLPKERSPLDSKIERLTPRSSFKVHKLEILGQSSPWDLQDINVASRFNRVFMSYAFQNQDVLKSDISVLELQNRYVNEFLATLAHELRNPLAPISAGLSLLEYETEQDQRKEYMTTMKRQVDHMSTMINDLMDVSRITQKKIKLTKEYLDLRNVIKEAIDSSQPLISSNKHELIVELPKEPVWVHGDRTRLNQVFVNILTNAAKYTDNGGKIEIGASKKGRFVSVKIKDNGMGIESKEIPNIFTLFTQMDTLSSQSKSGLGIGLTLVKQLLDLHQSEIHAYSKGLGHGSVFEVLMPVISPNVILSDSANQSSKEEETDPVNYGTILIIDDNEDLVKMLKIILEKKNYSVITAYDGVTGLKYFSERPVNFAIIDLGLPDINGFELCERMKNLKPNSQTVYFSHSGLGDKEKVDRSVQLGFKAHFVKPVQIDELLRTLSKYAHQ